MNTRASRASLIGAGRCGDWAQRFAVRRRGMAAVVVLLLIAISLAVSYSVMRSQATAVHIRQNANLKANARRAAVMGMIAGLQKMRTASWAGVDNPLVDSISEFESYTVQFVTGDDSLTAESLDYWEYPYRVTVSSTGIAQDPVNPSRMAKHEVRAVVRLVPRKLAPAPTGLEELTKYALRQRTSGTFQVNVPCRIEGSVLAEGSLEVAKRDKSLVSSSLWYAWSEDARRRYLEDLNAIRKTAPFWDWRPFDSQVLLRTAADGETRNALTWLEIGTASATAPTLNASAWQQPGVLQSYRLYPGGKAYSVASLGRDVSGEFKADPRTNPLGLYWGAGEVRLKNKAWIEGTLVTKGGQGNLYWEGADVQLEPARVLDLRTDDDQSQTVELPAAVVGESLRIQSNATGTMMGFVAAWDDLDVTADWGVVASKWTVDGSWQGKRLEDFVKSQFATDKKDFAARMIEAGAVKVNGAVQGPNVLLTAGQAVTFTPLILQGPLAAKDIFVRGRSAWSWWSIIWDLAFSDFKYGHNHENFALWLAQLNEDMLPVSPITIRKKVYRFPRALGSAIIDSTPHEGDKECDVKNVSYGASGMIPLGACFALSQDRTGTIYKVCSRAPKDGGPTTHLSFEPGWGATLPSKGSKIWFFKPQSPDEQTKTRYWKNNWQDPNDTLFVPDEADGGLRWELLKWTDVP